MLEPVLSTELCLDAVAAIYTPAVHLSLSPESMSIHHPAVGILAPVDSRDLPSRRGEASPFQPAWVPGQDPANTGNTTKPHTGWGKDNG